MSKSKQRRIFPAVYFVNGNPLEERVQVLLSENKLRRLPDNPNIFMKSNNDHYVERPNATFCNGKYSILEDYIENVSQMN